MGQEIDAARADELFRALAEQLHALGARYEIVVIGGAALQALGFISRPTADVDVVGLREGRRIVPADTLPAPLADAAVRVARDFGLPEDWLNTGPTELVRFGLPAGFETRCVTRSYGPALTVEFASRYDQIHFKLYAMVDQGAGRHESDLRALDPATDELLAAARWARTHDASEGFHQELLAVLRHLGVPDADVGF
jgi:hypothetical protein